jgi:hypothetical protein
MVKPSIANLYCPWNQRRMPLHTLVWWLLLAVSGNPYIWVLCAAKVPSQNASSISSMKFLSKRELGRNCLTFYGLVTESPVYCIVLEAITKSSLGFKGRRCSHLPLLWEWQSSRTACRFRNIFAAILERYKGAQVTVGRRKINSGMGLIPSWQEMNGNILVSHLIFWELFFWGRRGNYRAHGGTWRNPWLCFRWDRASQWTLLTLPGWQGEAGAAAASLAAPTFQKFYVPITPVGLKGQEAFWWKIL